MSYRFPGVFRWLVTVPGDAVEVLTVRYVRMFARLVDAVRYALLDGALLGLVVLIVFIVVGTFLGLIFRVRVGDDVFKPIRKPFLGL